MTNSIKQIKKKYLKTRGSPEPVITHLVSDALFGFKQICFWEKAPIVKQSPMVSTHLRFPMETKKIKSLEEII